MSDPIPQHVDPIAGSDPTATVLEAETDAPVARQPADLTSVPALADAHAANAAKIETLTERLEDLAAKVEPMIEKGAAVAETGIMGAPAAAAGGLIQEIVNFLHHIFPGHNVPGTPDSTVQPASQASGVHV